MSSTSLGKHGLPLSHRIIVAGAVRLCVVDGWLLLLLKATLLHLRTLILDLDASLRLLLLLLLLLLLHSLLLLLLICLLLLLRILWLTAHLTLLWELQTLWLGLLLLSWKCKPTTRLLHSIHRCSRSWTVLLLHEVLRSSKPALWRLRLCVVGSREAAILILGLRLGFDTLPIYGVAGCLCIVSSIRSRRWQAVGRAASGSRCSLW